MNFVRHTHLPADRKHVHLGPCPGGRFWALEGCNDLPKIGVKLAKIDAQFALENSKEREKMNQKVIKYIRENFHESAIFQDNVQSGYLVFCDETGQQYQPYKINDESVVFVVHEAEWDDKGWVDQKGFSFRYKLHLAGYRQDGVEHGKWSKVTVGMLWDLAHDYTLSHPKDVHLEVTGLSLENIHMTDGHYKWDMSGKPILK